MPSKKNEKVEKSNSTVKPSAGYRAGFVGLLGEPNAGKSTLLNVLLGEEISAVSEKPQTTRERIKGIVSTKEAQVIFVDAPGTVRSTSGINSFLQAEVDDVVAKSDAILVVLSCENNDESAEKILKIAKESRKPMTVIVTKGDLLVGDRAPKCLRAILDANVDFVVLSALKREDETRRELMKRLIPQLPEVDAPLYDEELLTTETMRKLSAEFVREACFQNTRQEIPYGLAVRIAKFVDLDEESKKPMAKIYADIVVEREAHKGIVIGAKGANLKKIGMGARKKIEKLMGQNVYLELHVDVREGWTKNKRIMKELGYVLVKN